MTVTVPLETPPEIYCNLSVKLRFADLNAGDALDAGVFGGKAVGLARLHAANARVPDGFAVSVASDQVQLWSPESRDAFTKRVSSLLESGSVAVRSSAALEDSTTQSFAGMFESVLGITSASDALAAADRCIASGGSERVRSYRGVDEALPVGLVVQSMIEPRAAGVCFTIDPAGLDHAIVVEAVEGRGEQLVSGAANPERWRIYSNGAGAFEARRAGPAVLSRDESIAIAVEARRLEHELGFPLDLEWAIDSSGLTWMVQARPVTAKAMPPEWDVERSVEDVDDGPVTLWANWNVKETLPEPLYPLTWTIWRDEIIPMTSELLYGIRPGTDLSRSLSGLDLVNGRVYFNMNAMLGTPLLGRFVPGVLEIMDARTAAVVQELVASGTLVPRRLEFSRISLAASGTKAALVSLYRARHTLSPSGAMRRLERGANTIAARPAPESMSDVDLAEEMRLWSTPACGELRDGLQFEGVAMIIYALARRAFRDHAEALSHLATGIPANPTTQISLAIERLGNAAKGLEREFESTSSWHELREELTRTEAGRGWLRELSAFLEKYGHRGPREFDIGAGRWAEDPSMIVDLVRIALATPPGESMTERLARLAKRRDEIIEQAIRASAAWRRPAMRILARLVWHYMPLREAPKHYGVVMFQRIRNAAKELGRRLVARNLLGYEEDVFFLEWPELRAMALHGHSPDNLEELLTARKERLERFRTSRPPDMLRSDLVPIEEEDHDDSGETGVLRGVGAAPGVITGRVRILSEPDPRAMSDGDVLVVEYADPGWTPLFPRASAVVMEIGGLMCHAAVVAREMGLPAVFGVRGATTLLQDGDIVEVDGGAGRVKKAVGGAHGDGQ